MSAGLTPTYDASAAVHLAPVTVASYLLHRLHELGVDHVFGVPGDFVLGFLAAVEASPVHYVGTCNELGAAYAADGYARMRGVGALVTTYAVGELSALNGVAGAFAEHIPVVVVTGGPPTSAFATEPLLHHTLGNYAIPQQIYAHVTVASSLLMDGHCAPAEIDRVLTACLAQRRPVYLCLPSDVVDEPCAAPLPFVWPLPAPSDPQALQAAVAATLAMLSEARRPLVVAGVEVLRFHLQPALAALLEQSGLPYTTMMLGKSVLSEQNPRYLGLYQGDRTAPALLRRIEAAECVLQVGTLWTDFNTGGFTAQLQPERTVSASLRSVQVGLTRYNEVYLGDFLAALTQALIFRDIVGLLPAVVVPRREAAEPPPSDSTLLTIEALFVRIQAFLQPGVTLVADTGVALFCAATLRLPDGATFLGQTFYGSIGYSIGAALGAGVAAPGRQLVLIVGDGALQMTCQELSTMLRYGLKPLILVLNNDGYTIERLITDHSFNDIAAWRYHKLPDLFGGGLGLEVHTVGDLRAALAETTQAGCWTVLEAHTDRMDAPESLRRAGASMAKTNHLT